MPAEVKLSDGTTITTEQNVNSDAVVGKLQHDSFQAITADNGKTYRVNPVQVVYVRDL